MASKIKIEAKCPDCRQSLMSSREKIDDLDSICLDVTAGKKNGHIYLSQIYGSYNKILEGIEETEGQILELSCPSCEKLLPEVKACETCGAPMVEMDLKVGGSIKVCSRNGCEKHALEFENADDAFYLFMCDDESGYM